MSLYLIRSFFPALAARDRVNVKREISQFPTPGLNSGSNFLNVRDNHYIFLGKQAQYTIFSSDASRSWDLYRIKKNL